MAEIVTTTQSYNDTDAYWKFSITFDRGSHQAIHTYFYATKELSDIEFAKADAVKGSLTESGLSSLKLENNVAK